MFESDSYVFIHDSFPNAPHIIRIRVQLFESCNWFLRNKPR